jgi:vacuolar protein sorting-associated protein 3
MTDNGNGPRKRRKLSPPEAGTYVLRSVLDDIPLQAEPGSPESDAVTITCVEYWSR